MRFKLLRPRNRVLDTTFGFIIPYSSFIISFKLSRMIVHPWHGIEPGDKTPELVECIIEVPRGSRNKYELDKKSGLLRLDRVLYSAVFYPANYGFIPQTYCDDRDPLDILVLGQESVVPMCILTARPIGVMQMIDQDEEDDKIIAVHEHDPAFSHYRDISELPQHTLFELQQFFEDYKKLEHKQVRIERFKNCAEAQEILNASIELYRQTFHADGTKRSDAPVLKSEVAEQAARNKASLEAEEKLRAPFKNAGGENTRETTSRTPSLSARAEAARRAAERLSRSDEEDES